MLSTTLTDRFTDHPSVVLESVYEPQARGLGARADEGADEGGDEGKDEGRMRARVRGKGEGEGAEDARGTATGWSDRYRGATSETLPNDLYNIQTPIRP